MTEVRVALNKMKTENLRGLEAFQFEPIKSGSNILLEQIVYIFSNCLVNMLVVYAGSEIGKITETIVE